MKIYWLALTLALLVVAGGGYFVGARKAACASCVGPCMSDANCQYHCGCALPPGELEGVCVSK